MLQKMQLVRSVGITAALALTVVVSGCGGGDSNKNEAVQASFQLGQSNFQDVTANRNHAPDATTLASPSSVATNGTLFVVADTNNNRIVGFNSVPTSGSATASFQYGQLDLTSNTKTDLLSHPSKVAFSVDGTKMLVVDSGHHRVLIWDPVPAPSGSTFPAPTIVIGTGTAGTSTTALRTPTGASFIGDNGLAVADNGNNRVLIFPDVSTSGAAATVVLGQRDFVTGQGLPNCPQDPAVRPTCSLQAPLITADTLSAPYDVWAGADSDSFLISDGNNSRVLYFITVPTGTTTVAGGKAGQLADYVIGQPVMTSGGSGGGGPALLNRPRSVWTDRNSSYIYVADAGNNRVLAFNTPFGNGQNALAVYGQGDFTHVTGNDDNQNGISDVDSNHNPEASDRTLFGPQGMTTFAAVGGINKVYVADTLNSRLMVFNAR